MPHLDKIFTSQLCISFCLSIAYLLVCLVMFKGYENLFKALNKYFMILLHFNLYLSFSEKKCTFKVYNYNIMTLCLSFSVVS